MDVNLFKDCYNRNKLEVRVHSARWSRLAVFQGKTPPEMLNLMSTIRHERLLRQRHVHSLSLQNLLDCTLGLTSRR